MKIHSLNMVDNLNKWERGERYYSLQACVPIFIQIVLQNSYSTSPDTVSGRTELLVIKQMALSLSNMQQQPTGLTWVYEEHAKLT